MCAAVAADIKKALGHDQRLPYLKKAGLEFLLSIGLTVKEPSERIRCIIEAFPYALAGNLTFGRTGGRKLEKVLRGL